jgi:hypothetical protein
LQQASSSAAKPVPDGFPRLLSSFTAGKVVEARLVEQGMRDYTPYVYSEGLMERAVPAHREVLEQVWLPYAEGRVPMADAVRQIVDALPGEAR